MKPIINTTEYVQFLKTNETTLNDALLKIKNGNYKNEIEELRSLLYQGNPTI